MVLLSHPYYGLIHSRIKHFCRQTRDFGNAAWGNVKHKKMPPGLAGGLVLDQYVAFKKTIVLVAELLAT